MTTRRSPFLVALALLALGAPARPLAAQLDPASLIGSLVHSEVRSIRLGVVRPPGGQRLGFSVGFTPTRR
jgi:hypothetical protein